MKKDFITDEELEKDIRGEFMQYIYHFMDESDVNLAVNNIMDKISNSIKSNIDETDKESIINSYIIKPMDSNPYKINGTKLTTYEDSYFILNNDEVVFVGTKDNIESIYKDTLVIIDKK